MRAIEHSNILELSQQVAQTFLHEQKLTENNIKALIFMVKKNREEKEYVALMSRVIIDHKRTEHLFQNFIQEQKKALDLQDKQFHERIEQNKINMQRFLGSNEEEAKRLLRLLDDLDKLNHKIDKIIGDLDKIINALDTKMREDQRLFIGHFSAQIIHDFNNLPIPSDINYNRSDVANIFITEINNAFDDIQKNNSFDINRIRNNVQTNINTHLSNSNPHNQNLENITKAGNEILNVWLKRENQIENHLAIQQERQQEKIVCQQRKANLESTKELLNVIKNEVISNPDTPSINLDKLETSIKACENVSTSIEKSSHTTERQSKAMDALELENLSTDLDLDQPSTSLKSDLSENQADLLKPKSP